MRLPIAVTSKIMISLSLSLFWLDFSLIVLILLSRLDKVFVLCVSCAMLY